MGVKSHVLLKNIHQPLPNLSIHRSIPRKGLAWGEFGEIWRNYFISGTKRFILFHSCPPLTELIEFRLKYLNFLFHSVIQLLKRASVKVVECSIMRNILGKG